ncbi:MAG: 2'-5' RNA ligase family protein [Legionellaceae bacterium]|nr:2'-5' RNA ligase family protein [Legionellaceae bacterium]
MKKYNIALLPVNKRDAFIAFSQKFSIMDPLYNLSEKSLPHVTLCQFYREESEVEATWEEVCAALNSHALDLEFKSFSFITFDNTIFWISLMPRDVPKLYKLQAEVASVLKVSGKKPFDPHLTLMSTLDAAYESKAASLIEEYRPIADKFILALGECDELGQFVNIIHQKELAVTMALTK